MTDNFALLGEARRPWLDADLLKEKFLARSACVHPDRVHQSPKAERDAASQQFAELNAAYNCLREPKERLRHLLELERGAKLADIERVPDEMMLAMFEIGRLCKKTDAFLTEHSRVTSPILKVQSFEQAQEWIGQLEAQRRKIQARRDELLSELKGMNAAWETADATGDRSPLPLERLDKVYRLLGYLGRSSAQIQERIVRLSF